MGGVDVAFQRLQPVAFPLPCRETGLVGRGRAVAHIDVDQTAALGHLVGPRLDLLPEVLIRRQIGHVEAIAGGVEFPAVIDAAQAAFLVAAEEQRRTTVRAAWSSTPIRPALSRKAINRSPSSIKRSGSPSASSSDDRHAGNQYCRLSAPIGVLGPTRVSSSFSVCDVMS